jgi:hypothetical protein
MSGIELTDFWRLGRNEDERLAGLWFEIRTGENSPAPFDITIDGWVVGKDSPVERIEMGSEGRCIWAFPPSVPREDVKELHPDVPWAERSGFQFHASALKLRPQFELQVGVVLEDGTRIGVGRAKGRRRALTAGPSQLDPILVSSLGRTGSTWVMALLEQHPEVVVFRPFEYEPRVARYWAEVFGTLCEPSSFRQALGAVEEYDREWWTGKKHQLPPVSLEDPEIERWMGGHGVEATARVCRSRIDAFYEYAAKIAGKEGAGYFAEKTLPETFSLQILPELYQRTKHVFLVRDFRDMAASILAFDRRRGFSGFGRQQGATDEDFVRNLGRDTDLLVQSWNRVADSAHLLRYEDLIVDPPATLGSLLSGLGLESNEILVERMLTDAAENATSRGHSHPTSSTPAKSIARWRTDLEPSLQAACEEAFGRALEVFGYDEDLPQAAAASS